MNIGSMCVYCNVFEIKAVHILVKVCYPILQCCLLDGCMTMTRLDGHATACLADLWYILVILGSK